MPERAARIILIASVLKISRGRPIRFTICQCDNFV
jgi:hypothetical protein